MLKTRLEAETKHLPTEVQTYWRGLLSSVSPSTLTIPTEKLPHFLWEHHSNDEVQEEFHGSYGGAANTAKAKKKSKEAQWDTAEYAQSVKTVGAQVRAVVLPACSDIAVDHATRVLIALDTVAKLCAYFHAPHATTVTAAQFTNLDSKAVRCKALKLQLEHLRPAFRFLRTTTLATDLPLLWEALEEYMAAALGAPLNSTIDLTPGGVDSLEDPDTILEQAVVATAVVAHMQCFAGDSTLLVPKARDAYAQAVKDAPASVRETVERALEQSGSAMAVQLLGPPTPLRTLTLAACNAVAALMRHEIQTLASGSHAACVRG